MNDAMAQSDPASGCPCGSGSDYEDCCDPLHRGATRALTAEQLMRSRFSAYAQKNASYLLQTWDKSTRPTDIDFSATVKWIRLEIVSRKKSEASDRKGIVEFKAHYRSDGQEQVMHEISRFHKVDDRWVYLDGSIKSIGQVGNRMSPGRNAPCPCGSGKKAKRCCGK
jgi:SEC-C motif-containing protein